MSIRVDACGDPLNIEGESRFDERTYICALCDDVVSDATFCELEPRTWSQPAAGGWICARCLECDPRERGEDDGQEYGHPRDALDERRDR